MHKKGKILITKVKLLLCVIAVLLCNSCSLGDYNGEDIVETTSDVATANEIDVMLKAMSVIYEQTEIISNKIAIGQTIGINISNGGRCWSYIFNDGLLSGEIIIDIERSSNNSIIKKTVNCYSLKIHYYGDTWLKLFGTMIIDDATDKIITENFGYAGNMELFPKFTISSDYLFRQEEGCVISILPQSSGYCGGRQFGTYRHTVESAVKVDKATYNIVSGKIFVFSENTDEESPIEIEYSQTGRTVTYKGNTHRIYYNN